MKLCHTFTYLLPLGRAYISQARTISENPQPIIIDTDIFGDVDDVGALYVANILHNCGLADLRGVAVNTNSQYGALAVSVSNTIQARKTGWDTLTFIKSICTYFGNSEIPIAALRPLTNETFFDDDEFLHSEYASKVANNWPRNLRNASSTPTPVELYRSILAAAANQSMNIISIGFLTNLKDVLKSKADEISPLSGSDLIAAKTRELVVMGGAYPSGSEYNFGHSDPESTAYVLKNWPKSVAITYSGFELGGDIDSGQNLDVLSPPNSPILAAYQWYVGRGSTVRPSWDPITTLYGSLGLDGFEKLGLGRMLAFANRDGHNSLTSANASNAWVNDTSVTNQHWLKLADGVTNSSMSWLLDRVFTHDPVQQRCFSRTNS
ncbi:hypothetical protein N7481_010901 [Penicillium waksmanii]|uniref:uncharacterized protein n=1 Tax=Penicillium waksmanii TaxID=69791 RepID=UPI002547AEA6|nr:uncharacterized protein N7481_010901 [Penicillium waksmanii]KAJ5973691.1 hypothetical protein N7481_010901 [Penicillium waksmanii]